MNLRGKRRTLPKKFFSSESSKELFLYLGMFVFVVLFFAPLWLSQRVVCFGDVSRFYYPLKFFASSELQQGRLPLWNPHLFCGTPLLANLQTAIFSPLSLICYLLPFPQSFNYYLVAHFVLAGWFMVLLLRSWPAGRLASLISGTAYVLGGFFVSSLHLVSTLSAIVWVPLAVFFFRRLISRPGFFNLLPAMVSCGFVFLGGEPTVFLETFGLLFFYALFSSTAAPERPFRQLFLNLGWLVALGAGSLIVISIQLLPFLELVGQSVRGNGTPVQDALAWSIPPAHLLTLIFPFLYGNLIEPNQYHSSQLWLNSFYPGVAVLCLALLAFFYREKMEAAWLWIVALLSVEISLGIFTPLYPGLYRNLPFFNYLRYPVRFIFLTSLVLPILAGLGWDGVMALKPRDRWKPVMALAAVLVLAVFLLIILNWFQGVSFSLAWRSLGIVCGVILALLLATKSKGAFLAGCLVLGLVFFDLLSVHESAYQTVQAGLFTDPPLSRSKLTKEGRLFLDRSAEEKGAVIYGRTYDEALGQAKNSYFTNLGQVFGVDYVNGYDSLFRRDTQLFLERLRQDDDSQKFLLNLAHCRYIVSARKLQSKEFAEVSQKPLFIYENLACWPKATVVGAQRQEGGNLILDWKERQAVGTAEIKQDDPDKAVIEADLKKAGVVILGESFYPGWKAEVDGVESAIYRVEGVFRGVLVPVGKHKIVYYYRPGLFIIGSIASYLALAAGLALVLIRRLLHNTKQRG